MTATQLAPDAAVVAATREAAARPLGRRRLVAEGTTSLAFVVAAAVLAVVAGDEGAPWRPDVALVLVAGYALATRAQFEVRHGLTDATPLFLVALLLLTPVGWAPLLVCAGLLLGDLPDLASRRLHPDRLLTVPANCWHALAAAGVLAAAGAATPDWGDAGWYLAALGASFAADTASGAVRSVGEDGVSLREQLGAMRYVVAVDAALSAVGLLAAFAAQQGRLAPLLLLPLVAVLRAFAGEREQRLTREVELLESELHAARGREEVLAALSHGLRTPLAGVVGLTGLLARSGASLPPERLAEVHGRLHGDALRLRHRVRQALDFQLLRAGGTLPVAPVELDLGALARELAEVLGPRVVVRAPEPVAVRADRARAEQVLTALLDNALEAGAQQVVVSVSQVDGWAVATVEDDGPGIPAAELGSLFAEPDPERGRDESQGVGVGLFVARGLARAHGGDVEAAPVAGGGSRFTVRLPAGPAGPPSGP